MKLTDEQKVALEKLRTAQANRKAQDSTGTRYHLAMAIEECMQLGLDITAVPEKGKQG